MKNSLFLLGAAAIAALSSCSQSEVMEVAENRAIGFNTFVNNNTRAVTEITTASLSKFYVFGDYDDGASVAFNNTEVGGASGGTYTPVNPAYWQTSKTYEFGAYSNGNGDQLTASFSNGALTISGYSVDNTKDLIAATASDVAAPAAGEEKNVPLTFKHLLSKVKFTFSTTAVPEAFRMEVSNLKFSGIKTAATCVFSNNAISTDWSGTDGEYSIATLRDYAVTGGSESTEDILVIPQANTGIKASFTVTIYDQATDKQIATNDFTASLACTETEWVEGNVYNYTAEINPDDVDDQMKEIKFTVTEVEEWQPDQEKPITPEK